MRLNEINYTDAKPVEGYGPGFFRIGGEVTYGGILTCTKGTSEWGVYDDAEPLLDFAGSIDVLFMGTGEEVAHIPADLRVRLEDVDIGVEAMATLAAARTYNVLLSEGRRIALAMIPV